MMTRKKKLQEYQNNNSVDYICIVQTKFEIYYKAKKKNKFQAHIIRFLI